MFMLHNIMYYVNVIANVHLFSAIFTPYSIKRKEKKSSGHVTETVRVWVGGGGGGEEVEEEKIKVGI